ncbi:NAD(P)-binding protein [Cadophora sp. DSE1049]|nr:NAD(P)-binding protein [Cadophora sp. DSE1049]
MTTDVSKYISRATEVLKVPKVQTGLGVLLVLGALQNFSRWLSRRALNNGATDKTWDWKKKEIVVVTGGCGGIGACIVSQLQEKGVNKIIVLDMIPQKSMPVDLSSGAEITDVVKRIRTDHGDPTVLINNAGIGAPVEITGMDEARLRKIFAVNIIAHFLLVRELLPPMIKANHGHIVTIASMASFGTQATNVDYACTKAGALSFHEGLTQELRLVYNAPLVRTSIVHPSWVRTPLIADLIESGELKAEPVAPEAVAGAVVKQILSGYGAQIIIPSNLAMVSIVRGLPIWVQESFRDGLSKTVLSVKKAGEKKI